MFSTGEIYGKLQAALWCWELGPVKGTGLPSRGGHVWHSVQVGGAIKALL